jgi:beta-lactamase regulating signal transducer with metallopeptidase domain
MSAFLESLNAFSAAGLTAFLNTLWLAFAVAAVIWLSLRLMPRVNAATRHAVWWGVLALVVILPLATLLPRVVRPAAPPAPPENQICTSALPPSAAKPLLMTRAETPALPLASTPAQASAAPLASAPAQALSSGAGRETRVRIPIEVPVGNWQSMLLFFWMGLSSVLLGRILLSYLHLRGLRNRARQVSADLVFRFEQHLRESRTSSDAMLLVSDEVISPMVAGFLHPVILLPERLLKEISEPELDYVLLHELAHVVRRDNWTNLMGRLVSAALVFHPVAAWVLHRIEREREIACDDWVVAATGSAFRYAATLARLLEFCCRQRRELLATGMAHRSSKVRDRIEILLRPRLHFSPGASLPRVSFCIAAGLALLSFGLRMPGWIAFAKSSPVDVIHNQAYPHSQISAARVAFTPETTPTAPPTHVTTLSSATGAQSSATAAMPADEDKTWRHEWKATRDGSNSSKVQLSLISRNDDGNDWMNTQGVPLSSLSGFSLSMLDHDGPVKFEYVRDSGRILCEGNVTGGRAAGPFTVELNPSFVSDLEKMGYAAPRQDEAFSLVISDVTLSYARAIKDTGLTSSISDLIDLQDHGVGADYVREVRQEGFTNLTAEEISDLRDHGVKPDYLKAIKAAGPNLTIEEVDSLYDHGVKPDYYKTIVAAAPKLSIEQIDSLYDHGVKPGYYTSMAAAEPQLSIEEVDSLYDHGVEPDSFKGFAAVDPKLSIEEIDSLRDHGVKPEYYGRMKSVAPDLSIEEIDSLFDHGVKPDSYKGFAAAEPKLSIEQIDSLYDHGVQPASYKGFAAVDPKLSIEEVDSLHDHGVEPEFYQGTKAADSTLSIEQINRLRDHGVTPEYLKEIRALPDGFSISDISELRDHGITANYIRNLHSMGMKTLTADQIVRLRDGD